MCKFQSIFLFCFTIIYWKRLSGTPSLFAKASMMYNVYSLVPCTDEENTLCNFNATTLKMYSGIDKFTLDGYFEIPQDLPAPIVADLSSTRCKVEDTNYCEVFQTLNLPNMCPLLNTDMFSFSTLLLPPIKCPAQKGLYTAENVTIDLGFISHLPLTGWIWKTRIIFESGPSRNLKSCVDFEWSVSTNRRIRRLRPKKNKT